MISNLKKQCIIIFPNEDNQIDYDTNRQLERKVDLSVLSLDMTLEQVLDIIANSVKPPLQIQPNWRDLEEIADILRTYTPQK